MNQPADKPIENTSMYLKGMQDCVDGKKHVNQGNEYNTGYSKEYTKHECASQGVFN